VAAGLTVMEFDGYRPNEKRILGVTGVAHFATHFFEQMYPTAAVAIALELDRPIGEVLGWSFLSYLLFGLGALPAGFLADRWEARRMLQLCILGLGVSSIAVAASPAGTGLVLSLGALGLFASIYHPAGMSLLASGVRARGRALGVNGIYGNVGIALAPAATAGMIAVVGWRGAYAALGAAILVVGLLSLTTRIDEPDRHAEIPSTRGANGVDHRVLFGVLCGCMILGGLAYRGTTLAAPAVFAERLSATKFGIAVSLVYLIGTVSQYVGGRLADRHDLGKLYLAFHLASLPALALMISATGLPLFAATSFYVFFALGMQPIENSLVAKLTPPAWRSTSYGIKFVLAFGIGAFAAPLVSRVEAAAGWSGVYLALTLAVAAIVVGASTLVWLARREPLRNRVHEPSVPGDLVPQI
jgi:MFS transporter, FSR family, fosmidomycin resistance protein